jgi:glycosyltransferase involved in cell wall biosynthesis
MSEISVLHVLDTLALGGAERAAVNLVNELPRDRYRPYLCTTRMEGPLREAVAADVGQLALRRKSRFDPSAIRRLVDFIRRQKIAILHAHGSSLFVAVLAAWFPPRPIVIWHAHYGRVALEDRRAWAHRLAVRSIGGVIAVNRQLAEWCGRRLAASENKIWCIPNMVCAPVTSGFEMPGLPGTPGSRIVCVANLRAEKDHLTLVRAMRLVVREHPAAHLFLVGAHSDPLYSASSAYFEAVKREVAQYSLEQNVSFLGQRQDIPNILRGCDIGVLSSKTEGLPVSLLEYGMAGLPVVATQVGECEEVLDRGRAGVLVPSQSPPDLAEALLSLLRSPERRSVLGEAFLRRVKTLYSATSIVTQVCQVYENVLAAKQSETACVESVQNRVRA